MSKKLLRSCVACRTIGEKNDFFRIARNKENKAVFDAEHKLEGRGAYVCQNPDCIKKCIKQKSLNRAFKADMGKEIYDELDAIIKKLN